MRIHRIHLQNFRGVADREVVFALDGVTIVEGPNEAGKTSIAEAIDLVLGVPDSSNARQVKAVQPVGRDAAPRVEIELSSGPYHFVYAKQWVKQRSTTLDIIEPVRQHLTGRDAHDRVVAILDETMDADLWAALRLEQGGELAQAAFDTPALARALDAVAGGEVASAREDDLFARIAAERDRYWTASGRPKTERTELAAAAEGARGDVERLTAELTALDEQAARVEVLGRRLAALQEEREGCLAEVEAAEGVWRQVDAARRELDQLERVRDAALRRVDGAERDLARRDELVDDVRAATSELEKLMAERDRAVPSLESAEARLDVAAGKLAAVDAELAAARGLAEQARTQLMRLTDAATLAEWRARRERIRAAEARRAEADALLHELTIDGVTLQRIDAAALALAEARARLEVAGARISTTLHAPADLAVNGVEEVLLVGDERSWVTGEDWSVTIDDRVTVRVEPGQGARALADAADDAAADLAALCARAGVATPEEAHEAHARRSRAERDIADAVAQLRQDLGDLTPSLLDERIAALEERLAAQPQSEVAADSEGEARRRLEEAEHLVAELTDEREDRSQDERSHRDRLENARVDNRVLAGRVSAAQDHLDRLSARLAEARAATTDEELRVRHADALAAADTAADDVARAGRELAALDPEGLDLRRDNARGALARVDAQIREASDERTRLTAVLDVQGERGLAADLDAAESRRAHLEWEHERLESRARAALLLHDTFEARRREARQRYVAPFRTQIERLARLVFGSDAEVELDEDLRIARRVLGGVALDFDQLSVGAREQLGLLARLACASIVADDGGAPVIFDDVLGYTDPERLRSMGAAIAAASNGCQVIVLTCTPGRYTHVGNARTVSLV